MKSVTKPMSYVSPKLDAEIKETFPSLSELEVVFPTDDEEDETNAMLRDMLVFAPCVLIQEKAKDGVAITINCENAFELDGDGNITGLRPHKAKRRFSQPAIRNKIIAGITAGLDESVVTPNEE